jgi:TRAP-type C4-dicarboxylate transport system substrate-binding protein
MTYKTLPTPPSTNKQVREYLTAVEKGYNSIFVTATSKGWNVLLPKDKKIVGTYTDKTAALAEAKKLAQAHNGEYFVFDEAGELITAA